MPSTFRQALSDLMLNRLTLIPWHHTNSGIEVQREHVWKLETLFDLLTTEKENSYLVAYDTMGFFSYLLSHFSKRVTYHSTRDSYDFTLQPKRRWEADILNMPPKHPEFDTKYDYIVVPTFFHEAPPAKCRMLLEYLKKLLTDKGEIVFSYSFDHPDRLDRRWYDDDQLHAAGFIVGASKHTPTEIRSTSRGYFVVKSMGVKQ
jgi:hypothetical protein